MTDKMKTLREMPRDEAIAIFERWLDAGEVERIRGSRKEELLKNSPLYPYAVYRLPVTYPTVDWSHVADWVQYIAFDQDGLGYAYSNEPKIDRLYWVSDGESACTRAIVSIKRGNCDWRDSLISRPTEDKK